MQASPKKNTRPRHPRPPLPPEKWGFVFRSTRFTKDARFLSLEHVERFAYLIVNCTRLCGTVHLLFTSFGISWLLFLVEEFPESSFTMPLSLYEHRIEK